MRNRHSPLDGDTFSLPAKAERDGWGGWVKPYIIKDKIIMCGKATNTLEHYSSETSSLHIRGHCSRETHSKLPSMLETDNDYP